MPERAPEAGRGCALSVGLLCVAFNLIACGSPSVERPNILIAVFDACRPDKIGCYGFDRPTTPAIDRFAADPDSVRFDRHYVQGSWTKPSTASLFTGLYLHQHQVFGGSFRGEMNRWSSVLPDELRTLAEEFQEAGYSTFAVTANPHLDPRFGFDQGFDTYSMLRPVDMNIKVETLRLAGEARTPFLGYVHFNGCHYPYTPATRDKEYFSTYGLAYDEPARVAAGIDFSSPRMAGDISNRGLTLEPDDVRFLNLLYEARLRAMDRRIFGPLMDALRDMGLYDETLIVFTADHGEELYDHLGYGHGHALWEEVIQVPLIVKFPKGTRPQELGSTWSGLSRAIDLYPALTAAAGLERPRGLSGHDLFQGPEVEFAFSDGLDARDGWALVRGNEKLMSVPWKPFFLPVAGRFIRKQSVFLFDLEGDPKERQDLAEARTESVRSGRLTVRRLWQALPRPREQFVDIETPPLSTEALETLRSLGYLEGTSQEPSRP